MTRNAVLTLAAFCSFATSTRAEFILSFAQVGSNVVATGSGSINTTALTNQGDFVFGPLLDASEAQASAGPSVSIVTQCSGITGPSSFGSNIESYPTSGSGDSVGVDGKYGLLFLPDGYVSGRNLSNTAIWDAATFSSLGMTPGRVQDLLCDFKASYAACVNSLVEWRRKALPGRLAM